MIGPMSVSGDERVAELDRARRASTASRSCVVDRAPATMRRPSARHHWPLSCVSSSTMPLAAWSRSASSSTTIGLLPPSSSWAGLKSVGARRGDRATADEAAGERDGADALVLHEHAADVRVALDELEGAGGAPACVERRATISAEHGGAVRRPLARLDDRRAHRRRASSRSCAPPCGAGAFHGTRLSAGPHGRWWISTGLPVGPCHVRWSAPSRSRFAARRNEPPLMTAASMPVVRMIAAVPSDSSAAMRIASASRASATCSRMAARSSGGSPRQRPPRARARRRPRRLDVRRRSWPPAGDDLAGVRVLEVDAEVDGRRGPHAVDELAQLGDLDGVRRGVGHCLWPWPA